MTEQKQWCEAIIIYFDALLITTRRSWEPRHSAESIIFFSRSFKHNNFKEGNLIYIMFPSLIYSIGRLCSSTS